MVGHYEERAAGEDELARTASISAAVNGACGLRDHEQVDVGELVAVIAEVLLRMVLPARYSL
ncbi:MAG: hypothetical protein IPI34_15440 [bacterium]|nr:hypothetical protein [bacterium]